MNLIRFKDKEGLKKQLFSLHKKLLGEDNKAISELFKTLHNLREGDIHELLNEQSDLNHENNEIAG